MTPSRPAVPSASRDALRVALFGMPAAGKSSLLGALSQAAEVQQTALGGRLEDPGGGLAELRHRVYDSSPRRTVEEILPFPAVFEHFTPGAGSPGPRRPLALIDCDGQAANDLLSRRKTLDARSPEGTLAREVLRADALLLVIDASAPAAQVDADFQEFDRFLRQFERSRGQRAEVGGLPVYLVLSKCDLLARPGDRAEDWQGRIGERTRQLRERFQDLLKRQADRRGPLPFGRLELYPWATAVKRPDLADAPGDPRQPYGVAELFADAVSRAQAHRDRLRGSRRRLAVLLAGAVALVAALGGSSYWLATRSTGPPVPAALRNQVESLRSGEGQTPSQRLAGRPDQLARRIAVLTEVAGDAGFANLPPDLRAHVTDRLQELRDYEAYLRRLREARPPSGARTAAELRQAEDHLRGELALPRDDWAQTDAGRLREDRLREAQALRQAVRRVEDWYTQKAQEGEALARMGRYRPAAGASLDWRGWQADARRLLEQVAAPPFREDDRLGGPDGPTYREAVLPFEAVRGARASWDTVRARLERQLNVSAALGLGLCPERPPVLVIPETTAFNASESRSRVQDMTRAYPRYEEEFRLANLPEAAVPDVRRAAEANYRNLLGPGQDWVLQKLRQAGPGDTETPARWQEAARAIRQSVDELADWRLLARVLRRLREPDPAAPDPVDELLSFLARDRFDVSLRRFSVALPRDLGLRPQGSLAVHHRTGDKPSVLTLEPTGEPAYDPQTRLGTHAFRAADGTSLVYRPGDGLWAQLPVRREDQDGPWLLSWVRGRSEVYQFEHLARGAFLHPADQPPASGRYYEDVRLQGGNDTRVPATPDMLPVVRLKP